ncbi:MAG: U32 family peptidase [Spirochaetales bacterium]|nr:U32 family peptidase [Spirochaetales bacterium]
MELLAPAGNLEKLRHAYLYGADAAYIGLESFSLRAKAGNLKPEEFEAAGRIKGDKKLYAALNILFHNRDMAQLESFLDQLRPGIFDAFILSDLGILPVLRSRFPDTPLHLSTQANCINTGAARLYRDLGFSRIIPGRELSLKEVEEMKRNLPDLEIELFVHGAMCLAYSGRCFLSAYMADRSANRGACTHPCRWTYRVLEEKERPGEYYPVLEEDGFTTILSSKDLCMIDHLKEIQDTGTDAVKIEGRMKSVYYTALVTRAYRKALDSLENPGKEDITPYKDEMFKVSHREFTTGFYFNRQEADHTTAADYSRSHIFLGMLEDPLSDGCYRLTVKNSIRSSDTLEWIGPDILYQQDNAFVLFDSEGKKVEKADHGAGWIIKPGIPVRPGYLLRKKIPGESE